MWCCTQYWLFFFTVRLFRCTLVNCKHHLLFVSQTEECTRVKPIENCKTATENDYEKKNYPALPTRKRAEESRPVASYRAAQILTLVLRANYTLYMVSFVNQRERLVLIQHVRPHAYVHVCTFL